MNQRREPRFQTEQSVAITVFGAPDIRLTARIRNLSGKGMGLEIDRPIAPGAALKIDLEDALLLGEVIYCRPDEASFYAGVELEHALNGLAELSRIVSAFAEQATPDLSCPEHAHAVIDRGCKNQQQPH